MKKKILALAAIIITIFTASNLTYTPQLTVRGTENIETVDPSELLNAVADEAKTDNLIERITDFASKFLGRKYVWGATGPKSFDCSGFTSYVFKNQGIELPRTSRMQYTQGETVSRSDLRAGDLMFFSSPRSGKGRVGHVAIVVSVNPDDNSLTFIHASSSKGISYQKFPDGGYYSRHYIGAKRVIDSDMVA